MVLVSTTLDYLLVDARTALRRHLADSRRTDLSKAFAAWVLGKSRKDPEFLSIVNEAAAREGAQQDFQTVAVLGFAAESKSLSAGQLETFRNGLHRQAGREPIVDGVPMAFCVDAIGILGVAAGTKALGDVSLTSEVVRWISKFLKSTYEMDRAEDWQRCLFAAADRQLGKPLDLAMPNSVPTADIRIALLARGLVDAAEGIRALEDAIRTLDLAVQEPIQDFDCDRAALRVAALEWVTSATVTAALEKERFISEPDIGAYAKARMTETPPIAIGHGDGLGTRTVKAPDINLSGKLLGLNQLARSNEVAVFHSAVGDQQAESGEMAHGPEERKKSQKRKLRRNERYERIDKALRDCAASRPRSHEEVFQLLDSRKVTIPNRSPFKAAGGWFKGFQQDRHSASVWLSQAWGKLNLPAFRPGPRK
jgi:hypothetical protein